MRNPLLRANRPALAGTLVLAGLVALGACSATDTGADATPAAGATAPAASASAPAVTSSPSATPRSSEAAGTTSAAPASADPGTGLTRGSTAAGPSQTATANAELSGGPSTPVAAPSRGTIKQKVSARPVQSVSPVAIDETASLSAGVTVEIDQVRSVTTKATIPGDVAGPAVQFTVHVVNGGDQPLVLDQAVLNVTGAKNTPGVLFQGKPTSPLAGTLAPGAKASGTYAFTLPKAAQQAVRIEVGVSPELPVASFTGALK